MSPAQLMLAEQSGYGGGRALGGSSEFFSGYGEGNAAGAGNGYGEGMGVGADEGDGDGRGGANGYTDEDGTGFGTGRSNGTGHEDGTGYGEGIGLKMLKEICTEEDMIGSRVIMRDNMAGVFVGTLVSRKGKEWMMSPCRKIHYWTKAAAVEGLATVGFGKESRITPEVQVCMGFDATQIVLCTPEEYAALMAAPVWTP